MKELIEMMLENLSTREVFLFRIACGACGAEYGGKQVPFSKAGIVPTTQAKRILFDALYEQELRDARNMAVHSAAENMNYCPICKQLVCNQCFLICEELDMCKQCAAKLQLKGQPVAPLVIEAIV